MPVVPTAVVARRLRALDADERSAFVADLWTARGFETAVEGRTVVAERRGGVDVERVWCGAGSPPAGEAVDTVVDVSRWGTLPDEPAVQVLGPADLREMLLYAVDRGTADRLFEAHCGHRLTASAAGRSLRSRLPGATRHQLLVAGLAVVLTVGLGLGSPGFGGAGDPVPTDAALTRVSPTPGADATAGRDRPPGGGVGFPPGLGASGVTDATALAAAHRTALANDSWELSVVHHGSHDIMHPFRNWSGSDQTIIRASHARYRYGVTGFKRTTEGTFATETYSDYGDGSANYRRFIGVLGDAFGRTRLPTDRRPGVFATLSAAYVHRYLATTESRVAVVQVGNETRTRVVATGMPTALARTVANYTAVALVDRRGVVRRLTVEYTLHRRVPDPTPNGVATPYHSPDDVPTEPVATVRFEMTLTDLGRATVTAPGWYERAVNATAGTEPSPWPNDPAI